MHREGTWMCAGMGSWDVHKALGKLFASSHMSSVCFAPGVPVTLSTALPLQRWRVFGDSNNPQQFWSFVELYKWLCAPRHGFHGEQLLGMCLLPQPVKTSHGELCSQCCHTEKQCKEGFEGSSFLYAPALDEPTDGIMSFPENFEGSCNEFKDT